MKHTIIIGILGLLTLILVGCGGLSLGDRVELKINPADQSAQVSVEMSDGLEVGMSGEFPIAGGRGYLTLIPATKTENARIAIKVYMATLVGGQLDTGVVMTLPNGAPLPVSLTPPLLQVNVLNSNSFDLAALFSVTPELQVAGVIGIGQFSNQYVPEGIAVCQNFRNAEKLAFAAVCIYGPKGKKVKGGLFVGGNFGEIGALNDIISPSVTRSLLASSSVYPLKLSELNIASDQWQESIHDPEHQLQGEKALKTVRNVQKVLKAKKKK